MASSLLCLGSLLLIHSFSRRLVPSTILILGDTSSDQSFIHSALRVQIRGWVAQVRGPGGSDKYKQNNRR